MAHHKEDDNVQVLSRDNRDTKGSLESKQEQFQVNQGQDRIETQVEDNREHHYCSRCHKYAMSRLKNKVPKGPAYALPIFS